MKGAPPGLPETRDVPRLVLAGVPSLTLGTVHRRLDEVETLLFAMLVLDGPVVRDRLVADLWPATRAAQPPLVNLRKLREKHRALFGREFVQGADVGSPMVALADDVQHDLPAAAQAGAPLFGAFLFAGVRRERALWIAHHREAARVSVLARRAAEAAALEAQGRVYDALAVALELRRLDPKAESAHAAVVRLYLELGDRHAAALALQACREMLHSELDAQPGPVLRALEQRLKPAPPSQGQAATPGVLLHPARLLCREAECARLVQWLEGGRMVFLEGEPGVGKTVLLLALRRGGRALVQPARNTAAESYGVLRATLRVLAESGLEGCCPETRDELARWLPGLGRPPARPPQGMRLALALADALRHVRGQGLSALLFDDVQAMDPGSLEVLAGAARRAGQAAPALLWAARRGEMPAPLAALQQALPAVAAFALEPLAAPAVERFLAGLDQPSLDARAWAAELARLRIGNPMQVLQIVVEAWERDGEGALAHPPSLDGPASSALREVLRRRIAALPLPARELACLAALAGGEADVELLARATGERALMLAPTWWTLVRAGLLRHRRLAHDLLCEVLVEQVPPEILAHQGRALAEAAQAMALAPLRVARLWRAAGDHARAAGAFERAAGDAEAANLWREALQAWDQAAAAWDDQGDGASAFSARRRALGAALELLPPAVLAERAQELAHLARSPLQQLDACIAEAQLAQLRADYATGAAAASRALALADRPPGAEGPPGLERRTMALIQLAQAESRTGDARQALQRLQPLADTVRAEGSPALRIEFLSALGFVAAQALDTALAIRAYEDGLALAEAVDDGPEIVSLASNLGGLMSRCGDFERGLQRLRQARALQREMGDADSISAIHVDLMLGTLAHRVGRFDEALAALQSACARLQGGTTPRWLALAENHLARLYLDLGQPGLASQTLCTPWEGPDATSLIRGLLRLHCAGLPAAALRLAL